MTTSDELRAAGKEIQGRLWPQTRTAPTGRFPAAVLAPEFFDYVQQTAFGMVWARPGLETRERSMITVAMLASLGQLEELRAHLMGAQNVGLSKDQLIEVLMQVAVYAGVPAAVAALRVAADVFGTD